MTELGPPTPALVVKANVAATLALFATRSEAAMSNDKFSISALTEIVTIAKMIT